VALALREYPDLNGWWVSGRSVPGQGIHVGMAVALRGGGVVAPAIRDADRLSLAELMAAARSLVDRVRGGKLRSSELADATITVTSLGERGVDAVVGVIQPPQVALVGFGRPTRRPWVVDDRVVPRPVVTASLSGDHRASDGHRGALSLARVEELLQEPEKL
jgi:pyruvate dehydrogenase E2 component (dihydrolipoamide acetyltransferase)